MTTAGDFAQVLVQGTYKAQAWSCVYWFEFTGVLSSANQLPALLIAVENIHDQLMPHFHPDFSITNYTAQNWKNVTESATNGSTQVGTATGEGMPTWMNYTMSWNRLGAGYNYPMKRYPGVPEAATDGNDIKNAVKLDLLEFMGDILFPITGSGNNIRMMTFREVPPIGGVYPPGKDYYPQYPTLTRDVKLGTQKTRK